MTRLLTALALMLATTAPAAALEPIRQEPFIRDTLLQGFIARKIADECPTIEPRKLKALGALMDLRDYALDKGYTKAEIEALVDDKAEKARAKAEAAEWLIKAGAMAGNGESYCPLGEAEIAKGSLIGKLLRSTK